MINVEEGPVAAGLRRSLGIKAGEHAHAALSAYHQINFETFYVEAGVALELAMKAKLAGISPYLLAPNITNWFKHGHQFAKGVTAEATLRSVSASEALNRLDKIEPVLIRRISTNIAETIARRDQSVHMGQFIRPSDETLLSHASTFVEAVNGLLVQNPRIFWDDLADIAAELVAAEHNAVGLRVMAKFAQAKTLLAKLTQEQQEALSQSAKAYVAESRDEKPELVLANCPACSYEGVASGELTDDGEPDFDFEDGEAIPYWVHDINTVVDKFECTVCGLRLDTPDEVNVAGIPPSIPNEGVDPNFLIESEITSAPEWVEF